MDVLHFFGTFQPSPPLHCLARVLCRPCCFTCGTSKSADALCFCLKPCPHSCAKVSACFATLPLRCTTYTQHTAVLRWTDVMLLLCCAVLCRMRHPDVMPGRGGLRGPPGPGGMRWDPISECHPVYKLYAEAAAPPAAPPQHLSCSHSFLLLLQLGPISE
jgi:hypothetical protein